MGFPLNRTDFKLYRGLSNPIQILIRDVDRVPVTFATGIVPIVNIIQRDNQQVVFTSPLTLVDQTQSLWTFTVGPTDLADWSPDWFTYTIIIQDASGNLAALYMDRDYGLEGQVEVFDGPYPPAISAVSLPFSAFTQTGMSLYSSAIPGAAQVHNLSGLHTLVVYGTALTGTVEVQGMLDAMSSTTNAQWLSIQTFSVTSLTGLQNFNVEGNYVWIRFVVTPSSGTFTKILARS